MEIKIVVDLSFTKESFRFADKKDYEARTTLIFESSHLFSKIDIPESFIVPFLPQKLVHLFPLREVKHSPDL